MSTALDNKVNPKILAKLKKHGRDVLLRKYTAPTVDEINSTVTSGTATDQTVKGFGPLDYEIRFIDGDQIKVGDCYFILSPSDTSGTAINPAAGHTIPLDGKVWRVVSVTKYSGGEDAAAYELQVRS